MSEMFPIDDKKVILKRYKLRVAGAQGATTEISLPPDALAREARRLGIDEEEAAKKLIGVWKYNSFNGLHLDFEVKVKKEAPPG